MADVSTISVVCAFDYGCSVLRCPTCAVGDVCYVSGEWSVVSIKVCDVEVLVVVSDKDCGCPNCVLSATTAAVCSMFGYKAFE